MQVLKSLCIAFSIYSKIPVPQFAWKEEDMKYTFCFFPWVGAIIGVILYFWGVFCKAYEIGVLPYSFICAAIPLIITGGFHVDGFMDTMDAFHSYQPRERKLEILKDSHIGAFAVIMLALYGLIYVSAYAEITDIILFQIVCMGFFLSRCLSGIAAVSFPLAKKEGSLSFTANGSEKLVTKFCLYLQGVVCIGVMLMLSWKAIVVVLSAFLAFFYYYYRCKRELDGITGDTAGYFVLICEGSMAVAAALLNIVS